MEKSIPRIGEMARDQLPPRGVGFGHDPCAFHLAGRQVNDEPHRIPNQSLGRPEFHGEEIGGGQYLPVSFEKLFSGESFSALGRRLQSPFFITLAIVLRPTSWWRLASAPWILV
jgi:hypothetical protein